MSSSTEQSSYCALWMKVISEGNYVEIQEPPKIKKSHTKQHPVLKSLKQGLKEVELIKHGKLKATPIKEFLNEL